MTSRKRGELSLPKIGSGIASRYKTSRRVIFRPRFHSPVLYQTQINSPQPGAMSDTSREPHFSMVSKPITMS